MPTVSTYSLAPFKGEFSDEHLLHLLRRTLFGAGQKELGFFANKSLGDCLDILVKQSPAHAIPVQEDSDVPDPEVPMGKTWINAPYEDDLIDNRRGLMLKMWWVGNLLNRDYSLTAKMTLFWHNHFVTEMNAVKDSRYSYRYIALLHKYAIGNAKKLIKAGTSDAAMLVYLNGNTNTKEAPNENYARELLELFTLGKGKESKYTEDDVRAAARVLSGWTDDKEKIQAVFHPELHDTDAKQFSSFFDNHVIKGKTGEEGRKEADELIDMIFGKRETARFVCRNLYRWFVNGGINEQVESNIIEPLADTFIAAEFEVAPVLRQLLGSEHFFDVVFTGCIVKSPVDFLIGAMRQFDMITTHKLYEDRIPYLQFYFYLGDMSMDISNPPSVAGWLAYYQAPKYHQWWANSASLSFRRRLMHNLASKEGVKFNGPYLKFDFVHFVSGFEKPEDADALVENSTRLLLPVKINDAAKNQLKQLLQQGQDTAWSERWNKYKSNPEDKDLRSAVEAPLQSFYKALTDLPEYQLM